MSITDYYGKKQGTTLLEIYTLLNSDGERVIHRQLCDQDAYDTWHLAYYFKEILDSRRLLVADQISFEQLPRKEKSLLLYLMLVCQPQFKTVLELGSSLFELIDGLELVKKYFSYTNSAIPSIDLEDLSYIGIELSDLLSFASQVLHPLYSLTLLPDVSQAGEHYDIFYDRSVTNYAFENSKEVAEFINCSEVSLLNFFVSRGDTFVSSRLGKKLTYFSLAEIVEHLDKPLYHLFGEKAPGPHFGAELSMGKPVVEGFFLCSEPDFARLFMSTAQKDVMVSKYFSDKQIILKDALTLELLQNKI